MSGNHKNADVSSKRPLYVVNYTLYIDRFFLTSSAFIPLRRA